MPEAASLRIRPACDHGSRTLRGGERSEAVLGFDQPGRHVLNDGGDLGF
jgi:hypothetical protein